MEDQSTYQFTTPVGKIKMTVPESSTFADRNIDRPNGHEPKLIESLGEELTSESCFYDIGACFGYRSLVANYVGVKPSSIHVFESNPFRAKVLKRNLPDGVSVNQATVGTGCKKTMSIDKYISTNQVADVIKIDIEGAEHNALIGMENLINRYSPSLYIEVHPKLLTEFGTDEHRLSNYLRDCGYSLEATNHNISINSNWKNYTNGDTIDFDSNYLLRAKKQ